MVFCGKPSKACAECRAKRTRCNEATPACGQCVRAGRKCSGYRDPLAMMFKDQNSKLSSKRKLSNATGSRSPSTPRRFSQNIVFESSSDLQSELSFTPGWEEQAVSFVFHNYVSEDNESASSRGLFDYLPALYRKSEPGSILADAVIALGMVCIANSNRDSALLNKAILKYSATARAVSTSLGDIELAKQDGILISVLLLGIFEANASDRPRSMASWLQHIKGSISLLKLRGNQQLETHIGRRLFVQLRTSIMTTCIIRRVTIPPEIFDWTMLAVQHETVDQAATSALVFAMIKFAELRTNLESPDYANDPYRIVADALEIDEMFYDWALTVPESFLWTPIHIAEPDEEVFADYYDVYSDVFTAGVWNNFRSIRVMLHEILIEHLVVLCSSPEYLIRNREILSSYKAQIFTSKSVICTLTHEICASVPFYFNYHQRDMENFSERPPVKALAGYLLMWPLYTAAVAGRVSAQMREWIAGRLKDIGDVMGVRHAYALGSIAGVKREMSDLELEKEKA
ncbi:hypothetical protein N431DRAFT_369426, partial [Stipitochalara longipes BDJ]